MVFLEQDYTHRQKAINRNVKNPHTALDVFDLFLCSPKQQQQQMQMKYTDKIMKRQMHARMGTHAQMITACLCMHMYMP